MTINRRLFLKASLGLAAISYLPARLFGAIRGIDDRPDMRRVIITVIRRECYADLQSIYLTDPETGPCLKFVTGSRIDAIIGGDAPEGFCPRAWEVISRAVASAQAGIRCDSEMNSGRIIVSCPDGTRPVVFEIKYHDA